MKRILVFIFLIVNITNGQGETNYFPQEQLIHEQCENKNNPSECLYLLFEEKVRTYINSKKVLGHILKYDKDTLRTEGSLMVDHNGIVQKEKSRIAIKGVKLNSKLKTVFKNLFFDTKFKKVLFHKNPPNTSIHPFFFNYLILKSNGKIKLQLLENKNPYNGGIIQEIPIFPGCDGFDNEKTKLCFQAKIQQHIKQYFKYPDRAFKQGISGTVKVIFTINKEGKIENIRTNGPHHLLEEEAVRIVKLIPTLHPALENGVPVKIPFSFPIHFKLN